MKTIPLTLTLAAAIFSAVFTSPTAEARPKVELELNFPFPFPFPGGPGEGWRPDRPGRDLVYQNIRREYRGDNVLPLRQILNLGPEYRGQRVRSVVLRAATAAGRGQAVVIVNGRAVTRSETVGTRMDNYVFQLPDYADEFGGEIRELQLEIRGNFFVEGVGVRLDRNSGFPGHPGGRPVVETIPLNREFRGDETLYLADYINLSRYRGMKLERVVLTASTRFGRGDATFCNSLGCDTSQDVDTVIRSYSFRARGDLVDRDAQYWTMRLRGNFYVQSIQLEFSR